ncbi:MAG: hypothetical protein MRY78_12550 [Saprospiraceae bacterium]|nr:hypothetical protein [Saprospiraceae bacterium]
MARSKLSNELKEAIALLPSKEKDKLLFRLIPKDPILVEQLNFRLLEDDETVESKRRKLNNRITELLDDAQETFYSPGYLLLDLRSISGLITRHVKVTRDKYGEVELNFHMLNTTFQLMNQQLRAFTFPKKRTFAEYVAKRGLKLIKLLQKMHEDYQLDFQDDMRQLGQHIGNDHECMKMAIYIGLDVNWLIRAEIPDPEDMS